MHIRIALVLASLCLLPSCYQRTTTVSQEPHDTQALETQEDTDQIKTSKIRSFFKRQQDQKTVSLQSYEQLKQHLHEYTQKGDAALALKYAEKMYAQCQNMEELCDLLLLCADLCFQQGNYKKASSLYNEFVRLYPSIAQKTEHAWYYAILCSENQQTPTTDRDQTTTRETITLAESFLKHKALFTTYTKQVEEVIDRCSKRLLDHDMGIVNFYIRKGSLSTAEKRLALIRKDFLPTYTAAEPYVLVQECRLAGARNNTELAERAAQELASKFPHYIEQSFIQNAPEFNTVIQRTSLILAEKQTPRTTHFTNRF